MSNFKENILKMLLIYFSIFQKFGLFGRSPLACNTIAAISYIVSFVLPCFFNRITTTRIMYKDDIITNKVGMTIFNLEVKDLNRLVKFKKINTLNSSGVPILGVYNIIRIQIASVYPASTLNLERMSFSTLNDFAVYVKLNKSVYLVNGCGNNALFCGLACNMVKASLTIQEIVPLSV